MQRGASAGGGACPVAGAFPVLPTVFSASGAIDPVQTLEVAHFVVGAGAAGFVFPGLASEYDCLTREERIALTTGLGAVKGEALFICGASAPAADEAAALARAGAEAGCGALMVLTPVSLGHDIAALVDWYARLAEETGLPIMLQNAPPPMGSGLPIDVVAQIVAAVPAIRYVKEEAMPSGQRLSQLRASCGDAPLGLFGGAGGRYLMDELYRGADGTMPASEIADMHVRMISAYRAGDEGEARTLFNRTLPLLSMQAIFRWRLTKEVLQRRGIIASTHTRAPGPALDAADMRELDILLADIDDLLAPATNRHGRVA